MPTYGERGGLVPPENRVRSTTAGLFPRRRPPAVLPGHLTAGGEMKCAQFPQDTSPLTPEGTRSPLDISFSLSCGAPHLSRAPRTFHSFFTFPPCSTLTILPSLGGQGGYDVHYSLIFTYYLHKLKKPVICNPNDLVNPPPRVPQSTTPKLTERPHVFKHASVLD